MWTIHHFAETDSTNRLAAAGAAGDVFTADNQTAGRGRLDHKWLSKPGENLMMSAVVDIAGIEPAKAATFPLAVGLAVANALSQMTHSLFLKWPNDIVVAEDGQRFRKLSGILCERHGDCVIAGIGVNVRQTEFPPEISRRATSLQLLGCDASVVAVRDAILDSLSRVVEIWRLQGFAVLLPHISKIDALYGRRVTIRRTDEDEVGVCGVCGGIAADGSLMVGDERIYAGEAHVMATGL